MSQLLFFTHLYYVWMNRLISKDGAAGLHCANCWEYSSLQRKHTLSLLDRNKNANEHIVHASRQSCFKKWNSNICSNRLVYLVCLGSVDSELLPEREKQPGKDQYNVEKDGKKHNIPKATMYVSLCKLLIGSVQGQQTQRRWENWRIRWEGERRTCYSRRYSS